MNSNDYHFVTNWRLKGRVDDVSDIIGDDIRLSVWWPSVYLRVDRTKEGTEDGVGKVVDLHTKGWLPYTLRWSFRVTESRKPYGWTLEAVGDFVGKGIWTFEQDGEWVNVTYDWRIGAEKPLLRRLSFVLKPLFAANHEWAMKMGEESLRLELARLYATNDSERAAVPAPPQATPSTLGRWLLHVIKGQ